MTKPKKTTTPARLGRPAVYAGRPRTQWLISIDTELGAAVDAWRAAKGMSRPQVIEQAVRKLLGRKA